MNEQEETVVPNHPLAQHDPAAWQVETALCCWEVILDCHNRFWKGDGLSTRGGMAVVDIWAKVGRVTMRRWAGRTADLVLQVYHHLHIRGLGPETPADYGFVPAVIEFVSWTVQGPELPGPVDDVAFAVLKRMDKLQESIVNQYQVDGYQP